MTKTLADIASGLEEPFPIESIGLLPKSIIEKGSGHIAMALPFADPRQYEDRLNLLAPGEWSTPAPVPIVAGQKIIVYVSVTICGVTHSDVGEALTTSENAATESWAQAFKRACSQFGLGRYLYNLEKQWVPFNKQRKQIELDAAGIQYVVRTMYSKAHIAIAGSEPAQPVETSTPAQAAPQAPAQPSNQITVNQIKSIKNLSKLLGREIAPGLETLSQQSARESIGLLSQQWKQKQFSEQANKSA